MTSTRPRWLDIDIEVPLVVALNGSLLTVDTLYEGFARLLFQQPFYALKGLSLFPKGRAAVKGFLAQHARLHVERLPLRSDLVDLVRSEAARGRSVHLVTAADQNVANAVAVWLGVFTTVAGSDGVNNLRGASKRDYLLRTFPNGFIYAGDDATDYQIFSQARAAILCDLPRTAAEKITRSGTPVIAELRGSGSSLGAWVRAFRIHQWSKNLLVFIPLIVGHAYGDSRNVAISALAFAALCMLASANSLKARELRSLLFY